MKKILFMLAMLPMMWACNQPSQTNEVFNNQIDIENVIDTIDLRLKTIDSLKNSGVLYHGKSYNIGKVKGVEVEVMCIKSENNIERYIQLSKTYGDYYVRTVYCDIIKEEVKYLLDAIDVIQQNLNREVFTHEWYTYTTKDKGRVYSVRDKSDSKWTIGLYVDSSNSDSRTFFNSEELQGLEDLMIKATDKIIELENKAEH